MRDSKEREDGLQPLRYRIGWMAAIWAGSVLALYGVAQFIRYWIS